MLFMDEAPDLVTGEDEELAEAGRLGVDCVSKRGLAPDVDDQWMTDVLSRVSVVESLTQVSKI